MLTRAIPTTGL